MSTRASDRADKFGKRTLRGVLSVTSARCTKSVRMGLLGFVFTTLVAAHALHAAPFVPDQDDEVLEVLPTGMVALRGRESGAGSVTGSFGADDLEGAVAQAWRLIEAGRSEGDPSYYGQAEGLLSRWWNIEDPPTAVLLVRATLLQNRHEFAAARSDLGRLLEREPRNSQAWLTRAVIEMVQGELSQAQRSCAALLGLANRLTAFTCLAEVGSLSGRADRSYPLLKQIVESEDAEAKDGATAGASGREEWIYALVTLAEMASRLGYGDEAARWFAEAGELAPDDPYLLAARADQFLDEGRSEAVVTLLAGKTRQDGLLLRLAMAEKKLGLASTAVHLEDLRARFAAARRRGDRLHLAEQSRFALVLLGDASGALSLARQNWTLQREPRDARVLLEAAVAANAPKMAEPVLAHIRSTGLEDRRLAALTKQLEAMR